MKYDKLLYDKAIREEERLYRIGCVFLILGMLRTYVNVRRLTF